MRNGPNPARFGARDAGEGESKSADHTDFPALLAEVLDVLFLGDFDLKAVSEHLECSPSQLTKFLKTEPRAILLINTQRQSLGLFPLK